MDYINMSTTGTEKHCRLCRMLSKGGTKACQYLLLKHVKEKPRDSEQNEWTLASFLNSKKENIIKAKLSKEQYKVLFPDTGDTVLSNWDLSLYCQVLTSYCGLKDLELLDIKQLRKTRNKLCHMNDAEIANLEFENKFEMIQAIIGRILEKVGDQDLKLEVDTIIKHLESGPLSMDETLKEMRKFYLMEMDIHEKLDHVKEKVLETHEKLDHVDETVLDKFERLHEKLEIINNKLDQRASSGIDSATNNVLVPGVDIFLDLKNVSDEEEKTMSDVLQKLFEEVINQNNDLKFSIPPNSYPRLREAVDKTFQLFLSKGWRIIRAKHECIQLHIRCSNFKSLADLFREHTNGKIHNHLTDLNEALAACVNGGKSYIETIIYKGEFWNVLDKSISFVDIYLSVLNIDVAKQNDNVQPPHKDRRATLSLTAQNVKTENNASFERDCNNELNTSLQLLKSELQSEFHAPHLSIQANCSSNVNRETDEEPSSHQDLHYCAMSETPEEETANWTKGCIGLSVTKIGLIRSVIEILKKKFYEDFSIDELVHLSEFVKNAKRVTCMYIKQNNGEKKGSWKIDIGFCNSGLCQTILDRLCKWHVNKSNTVAWNPNKGPTDLHNRNQKEKVHSNPGLSRKKCSICPETNCPFELSRQGVSVVDDMHDHGNVDKFYWEIANMFMFRGNEKNKFPNTGPEDTDFALILKLMKNCTLFSISDIGIYDELLEVRNLLMHSADNRLTEKALEVCFERMEKILKEEKFKNNYSKKAVEELKKLKNMKIIMTKLSSEDVAVVNKAFNEQRSALEFDIEVQGSLKNDYHLEGILHANKKRQDDFLRQRKTIAGATMGATVGLIGSPAGAVLGAAVGGLLSSIFYRR